MGLGPRLSPEEGESPTSEDGVAPSATLRKKASRRAPRSSASSAGQRADDRRQKIVSAALQLFSTQAYDDISIDDIAAAANVAHGLPSYYFGGKRGLYVAVLKVVQEDLQALTRPILTDGDTAAQIRGMARRHLEYFRAHPELMLGLLASTPGDAASRAVSEGTHRAGERELLRLLDLPVDPPPLLRTALRGCRGYLYQLTADWLTNGEDVPLDELVELCFEVTMVAVEHATGGLPLASEARRSAR
ncbi:hypothetical protein GCM10022222_07750 [Amycolatopsis ultiminotia]|uniref:HTH tetR-type domain-containing protein n=1 Tax=Amycolatopsis ultiminotia TaxID=543629 RepID=A0ABP6V560_9PSEU